MIEFGTALETLAFDQAVAILEPLQLAPETEAMWKQVSLFNRISPVLKSIFILSQLCIRCGPNVVTLLIGRLCVTGICDPLKRDIIFI